MSNHLVSSSNYTIPVYASIFPVPTDTGNSVQAWQPGMQLTNVGGVNPWGISGGGISALPGYFQDVFGNWHTNGNAPNNPYWQSEISKPSITIPVEVYEKLLSDQATLLRMMMANITVFPPMKTPKEEFKVPNYILEN